MTMNLIRYQTPQGNNAGFGPLARLSAFQNEMDRFFDLPFLGAETRSQTGLVAALDLYQDTEKLTVKAELPGLKREDINLSVKDGVLTISGERRQEKAHDEKGSLRNERYFGKFERSVTLPYAVNVSAVTATFQDGVLTVSLPKAEEAKPRQIEIK